MESKKRGTNELIHKNRNRVTDVENKLMVTRGWVEGGINWETGIDLYTLLYMVVKLIGY